MTLPPDDATRTIRYRHVVDLAHRIDREIPRWPGDPPVTFVEVADLATDGYRLRAVTIGEHSGTHVNAPSSLYAAGAPIEALDPASLVLPLAVIDARARSAADPDHALTRAEVEAWERRHAPVPTGAMVAVYTGWQERWADPAGYLGLDARGGPHFPGIAASTARWLIEGRGIGGVGIDTHGVDPGCDATLATNRAVLGASRLVVENLTNLDLVPATGATVVIGVLRLAGGTGSPASVLALVP